MIIYLNEKYFLPKFFLKFHKFMPIDFSVQCKCMVILLSDHNVSVYFGFFFIAHCNIKKLNRIDNDN